MPSQNRTLLQPMPQKIRSILRAFCRQNISWIYTLFFYPRTTPILVLQTAILIHICSTKILQRLGRPLFKNDIFEEVHKSPLDISESWGNGCLWKLSSHFIEGLEFLPKWCFFEHSVFFILAKLWQCCWSERMPSKNRPKFCWSDGFLQTLASQIGQNIWMKALRFNEVTAVLKKQKNFECILNSLFLIPGKV